MRQLDTLWLRLIDRWLWITPRQQVTHLARFAEVERSSATDMRLAARLTTSPERAAMYMRHAADETRHTQLFLDQARRIAATAGLPAPATPQGECEGLFERLGETAFLAFVHRAERRGRQQFEIHQHTLQERRATELAVLFAQIIQDERHHERYSQQLLEAQTNNADAAQRELRAIARWEQWRAFRRLGRHTSTGLYTVLMRALYFVCWPLASLLPKPKVAQLSAPTAPSPSAPREHV